MAREVVDLTTATAAYMAGIFVWAAATKLRDRRGFVRGLLDLGVGSRAAARSLAWAVPAAELISAAALMASALRMAGALLIIGLLLVFSLVVARNLWRGNLVACNCFGTADGTPLSVLTLGRNAALLLIAGALLLTRAASVSTIELVLSVGLGGAVLLLQGLALSTVDSARVVWAVARRTQQ